MQQLIMSEDEVTNLRIDEAKAPADDAYLSDLIDHLNTEDAYALGIDHGRAEVIKWLFEKLEGDEPNAQEACGFDHEHPHSDAPHDRPCVLPKGHDGDCVEGPLRCGFMAYEEPPQRRCRYDKGHDGPCVFDAVSVECGDGVAVSAVSNDRP